MLVVSQCSFSLGEWAWLGKRTRRFRIGLRFLRMPMPGIVCCWVGELVRPVSRRGSVTVSGCRIVCVCKAGGHTLLCMSMFPLSLTLSLRIWRGNFGLLYHFDWKQIVPAQFGPPLDWLTVVCEGKYARNLLSFHSAAVFFWISRLGSVRLLAGKAFAVRRVYSVVPSSPWAVSL